MKSAYLNIKPIEKQLNNLYGQKTNGQLERYKKLFNEFKTVFSAKCGYFASSSGRVEICGNHLDHNGGSVISSAISLDTIAVFLPNDANRIFIKSQGYSDIDIDLNSDNFAVKKGTSSALVWGVAMGLKAKGYNIGGFNACILSNVLGGAGISSSASFEVLIAEIFNFLYNDNKISNMEKAKVSQFAEREYFGKPCGLLDQTAIAYGGLNLLDFSNITEIKETKINSNLQDFSLILINSGGSHENLTNEYASIPNEMFSVAKYFNKERLIDVSKKEFYDNINAISNNVSDRAILRAIHFYTENTRVKKAYLSLKNNDYLSFLSQIDESGISSLVDLQNCRVDGSVNQPIVKALSLAKQNITFGACRVHGGGFAGTTLNIVSKSEEKKFIFNMSKYYNKNDIISLDVRKSGTVIL